MLISIYNYKWKKIPLDNETVHNWISIELRYVLRDICTEWILLSKILLKCHLLCVQIREWNSVLDKLWLSCALLIKQFALSYKAHHINTSAFETYTIVSCCCCVEYLYDTANMICNDSAGWISRTQLSPKYLWLNFILWFKSENFATRMKCDDSS